MTIITTCHCGATRIELPHPPAIASECNCSFCAKTGAIWGYYRPEEVRIVSALHDKVYSASQGLNLHHFCANCGGNTYGDSPDWASAYNDDGTPKDGVGGVPTQRTIGINMRLADDFDLSTLTVQKMDGRNSW